MRKNVAGQKVGGQMTTIADGTNFTGAVIVYVTGDAGTQAVGTVGSGACTHEGKGFHTYAPSQAETNFDHIAFTFEGTGAITATAQIYTTFPQTGDNFARLGAPVTASISADIATRLSTTGYTVPPTAAANGAAAWEELLATHLGAGKAGAALNAAGSSGDPWTTPIPGAYGAGTAGKILGDNINATISSRATAADADDIQTRLPAALVGGRMDSSVGSNLDKTGYLLSTAGVAAVFETAMTESYPADGATVSIAQALYMLKQWYHEKAISGTAITVKKLDGTTTAYIITTDNASIPLTATRTT